MTEHSAGAVLDPLGVSLDLADDQQVTEVVVIARVERFGGDGQPQLLVSESAGLDWVRQLGLVDAAHELLRDGFRAKAE